MTRVVFIALAGTAVAAVFVEAARPLAVVVAMLAASYFAWRSGLALGRRDASRQVERLRRMTARRFEREVGGWFSRDGWVVEHRGGKGDEGIDLVAFRGEFVVAVQCKRYAERAPVTPAQVRELYGAATAVGATHALLVTTGRYTEAAHSWVASLYDGPRMLLVGPAELASLRHSPRRRLAAP